MGLAQNHIQANYPQANEVFAQLGLETNTSFQAFIADVFVNSQIGTSCLLLDRIVALIGGLAHPEKSSEHELKDLVVQIALFHNKFS